MKTELTADQLLAIQKENESLKAQLEKTDKELAEERQKSEALKVELELTADQVLAIQKDNESLKAQLEKTDKELADERQKSEAQKVELEEAKVQNEDLGVELEKLLKDSEAPVNSVVVNPEPKPVVLPEVKVGKTKYKFLKGIFIFAGVQYKAEEAAADKELLEALLKIDGQQIIKEVH